jgi:hypothetical protein
MVDGCCIGRLVIDGYEEIAPGGLFTMSIYYSSVIFCIAGETAKTVLLA